MVPQLNYIIIIFIFILFLFTIMFGMWTYRKIQEQRQIIRRGEQTAMKILHEIDAGTYNEEQWIL